MFVSPNAHIFDLKGSVFPKVLSRDLSKKLFLKSEISVLQGKTKPTNQKTALSPLKDGEEKVEQGRQQ